MKEHDYLFGGGEDAYLSEEEVISPDDVHTRIDCVLQEKKADKLLGTSVEKAMNRVKEKEMCALKGMGLDMDVLCIEKDNRVYIEYEYELKFKVECLLSNLSEEDTGMLKLFNGVDVVDTLREVYRERVRDIESLELLSGDVFETNGEDYSFEELLGYFDISGSDNDEIEKIMGCDIRPYEVSAMCEYLSFRDKESLSYDDLGVVFGMTREAVRQRTKRAMNNIRRKLDLGKDVFDLGVMSDKERHVLNLKERADIKLGYKDDSELSEIEVEIDKYLEKQKEEEAEKKRKREEEKRKGEEEKGKREEAKRVAEKKAKSWWNIFKKKR